MRWGEPTRLPPVRRGRGLTAAALLAVGLVAAYAILAVLSLTSVAPSLLDHVPTTLQGVVPGSVPATQPKPEDILTTPTAPQLSLLSVTFPPIALSTSQSQSFGLKNTASTSVKLSVAVFGAPGVTAAFDSGQTTRLARGEHTQVTVTTDPMHAGSLSGGSVHVAIAGVSKPLVVPLSGAQAPLPPGAVTAKPEADGAVRVTWIASPSTGVAGYEVERRVPGGQWEPLPGPRPPQASSTRPAPTARPSIIACAPSPRASVRSF